MPDRNFIPNLLLEDRRIVFRNFSGAEGMYNAKGNRNFSVILEREEAEAMAKDGWNVKWLKPREEGDDETPRLEVTVKMDGKNPPKVVLVTSRGKTSLTDETIPLLDWAEIIHVDMIVRPYQWDVNGKTGIKAYLKSIYVTIREDALEQKYADVPDSAQNTLVVEEEEPIDPEA